MTRHVIPANQSVIEAAFNEFTTAHPEVYHELVSVARELRRIGYKKFGIATVYEVVRWRSMIRRKPGDKFKLNNNFRAYYARLIMEKEADLKGVFDTRRQGVPSHHIP